MIELSRRRTRLATDTSVILAGEILHLSQPFLEKDIHPVMSAYMKAGRGGEDHRFPRVPIDVDDRQQLMNIVSCIGTSTPAVSAAR